MLSFLYTWMQNTYLLGEKMRDWPRIWKKSITSRTEENMRRHKIHCVTCGAVSGGVSCP